MKKEITILGAGLVGSLLAVLFRKRNYSVSILERRPDIRKATLSAGKSINLAMSYRGWKAMEKAGLKTELEQIAIPMYGRQIHNMDGSTIFQAYGKNNEAIYSVSRSELNIRLMNAAEKLGTNIFFESISKNVDVKNNEVIYEKNSETIKLQADLLIGADGAFSSLRNAYVAMDKCDFQQFYIEHGYKELHIPAKENGAYALEKNALHIWPRKNFMLIALPNMDGSFTLTLFFPFKGDISFETVKTDSEILNFFETYFANTISISPNLLSDFKTNPTSSLITVKINPWTYQDKSLLIGDAAHAIVPFYGQGMNAGFEDCTELIEIIEKNNDTDWDKILQQYAKARKVNGDAVAQLALNNFIEMRDLIADPKFLERKKIEKELGLLYPSIYNSVYEMVSFTNTPYNKALNSANAQNELYNKIMQLDNGDFFENIKQANFKTKLDLLLNEYTLQIQN
jgi:kynurenine 3-monooxygenase